MFKLLKKPQCQKLSKFSGYRQTDRPTNLLLEAPTVRFKKIKDQLNIDDIYDKEV